MAVIDDGRSKLDGHSRVEGLNICMYAYLWSNDVCFVYVCMYIHNI